MTIKFYDDVKVDSLKFAVIVARHNNKWVFCKHKDRDTYEVPGGHREPNEEIDTTAKRELYEETGAVDFCIKKVCVYSVTGKNGIVNNEDETFGMLYFAEIKAFDKLPDLEMEKVSLFDIMPLELTYPQIQPKLYEKVMRFLTINKIA